MEFWGVEVKAGEPLKVKPDDESIIHLSQAALGESKKEKGNESVTLFIKINDKKIVLGTLLPENIPQLAFDLVFEKEVELSHNWKNGSIYFCGYQSLLPEEEEDAVPTMYSVDDSEDEEPLPLVNADNGAVQVKAAVKPAATKSEVAKPDSSLKQKVKPAQPPKADDESDDEDESDDDDDDEENGSDEEDESEEGMSVDDDSDDEEGSESEDEETPKKVEKGNKRPNDSAAKTPVPAKKQKATTPQKSDGKKGGHTATPHPAKIAAKTSANGTKPQTPKSGGKFSCSSCDRSFGSDVALQSHSKAKHGK